MNKTFNNTFSKTFKCDCGCLDRIVVNYMKRPDNPQESPMIDFYPCGKRKAIGGIVLKPRDIEVLAEILRRYLIEEEY